jgi:hypothetical protein
MSAQRVNRSDVESRVLASLAAFPFDLGSVHVSFTSGGGAEVSIHNAPAEEVAALATLLSVDADPTPSLRSSGPIRFGGTAYLSGGVSLDWYPAPPEPRPQTEHRHRQRQWDALTTALAASSAG